MHDAHPSPPSPPRRRSNWRGVAIAATCTAAMLVNSSNNTSVAIALPTIGAALHTRAAALQWLVSAYSLSSGCLLLFCGHLADVHGRKRVFVIGSIILFAFTLACAFVHDEVTLAVLRGFQGVGGAATIPAALGILAHEFPPSSGRARAAAFASFSAGGPIGAAFGMILGGLLTQLSRYTWRAQFYLSAALAFATLLLGIFVIPPDTHSTPLSSEGSTSSPSSTAPEHTKPDEKPSSTHTYPPKAKESSPAQVVVARPRDTRTDWPGAILSAAGLILLVFVLGQGAGPGQSPPRMFPGARPHVANQGRNIFVREHTPPPAPGFWNWLLDTPREPPGRRGPGRDRDDSHSLAYTTSIFRTPADVDASIAFDSEGELQYNNVAGAQVDAHGPEPELPPTPPPHGHHGPHEHHEPHTHYGQGPHRHRHGHHRHPHPQSQSFFGWLFGRKPRPHHHWHGPRNPPPGGFPGGFPPPPPPGGFPPGPGWGMPYIISLLLLSILLLALFGVWELHLERAHSKPGGMYFDASLAPPQHPHNASSSSNERDGDADDPRRSSASSASRPHPLPSARKSALPVTGLLTRIGNTRFGRAVRENRCMKAAARYTPPPLLPPSIFTRAGGRVGVVYGIALLQFAAFMIWAFWVQLYYQVYIGYSPVRTVVRLTPMFVTGIICNVVVALIVRRVPTQLILASGTLTTALAPLLFALIRPSAPYWSFGFPAAICSVVGIDFLFAAGMLMVSDAVGPGEQSVAGGVFQTMTQLGTSFGVTASTILFNHIQGRANFFQKDALPSYQAAMWMGVGFGGLATLLALVALRGVGTIGKQPQGPRDTTEKPAENHTDTNAAAP